MAQNYPHVQTSTDQDLEHLIFPAPAPHRTNSELKIPVMWHTHKHMWTKPLPLIQTNDVTHHAVKYSYLLHYLLLLLLQHLYHCLATVSIYCTVLRRCNVAIFALCERGLRIPHLSFHLVNFLVIWLQVQSRVPLLDRLPVPEKYQIASHNQPVPVCVWVYCLGKETERRSANVK